ncbi:MAG: adenylate/guanylate cyclase domain-containing protein, partial [Deltaproteobacteria bacterium]|nr:adenylate/guanylate cyclase domain-containing protein [Deltaproteobacteria bacterium]
MKLPKARLSRRIVLWVFASVIIIETIIFIPSYNNRKEELLDQLKMISWARVSTILQGMSANTPIQTFVDRIERLENFENIIGGAIYGSDGKKLTSFGDRPKLTADDIHAEGQFSYLLDKNYRYDIGCSFGYSGEKYALVLRNNAASVKKELTAFMLRIA